MVRAVWLVALVIEKLKRNAETSETIKFNRKISVRSQILKHQMSLLSRNYREKIFMPFFFYSMYV